MYRSNTLCLIQEVKHSRVHNRLMHSIDTQADIRSLGVIATELAHIAPPAFDSTSGSVDFTAPTLSSMYSIHFTNFVASCLEKVEDKVHACLRSSKFYYCFDCSAPLHMSYCSVHSSEGLRRRVVWRVCLISTGSTS